MYGSCASVTGLQQKLGLLIFKVILCNLSEGSKEGNLKGILTAKFSVSDLYFCHIILVLYEEVFLVFLLVLLQGTP